MRFEYGSAYDDDAAYEGQPMPPRVAAQGWPGTATGGGAQSAAEAARLVYVRYSPDGESRAVLVLLGRRHNPWGSIKYDLCRRCRLGHVWSIGVLAVMQGVGLESRLLGMARATAPDDYRWTRSGAASRSAQFWEGIPPELNPEPVQAPPCRHLEPPGRLREAWGCVRYSRLTGRSYWPYGARARHRLLRKKAAERR